MSDLIGDWSTPSGVDLVTSPTFGAAAMALYEVGFSYDAAPVRALRRAYAEERATERHLASTFAELEQWLENFGRTAQITYRIRQRPRYLVRIVKEGRRHHLGEQYVQATAETIEEALDLAIEAYVTTGEVPAARQGRKGRSRPEREEGAE